LAISGHGQRAPHRRGYQPLAGEGFGESITG
jgi:hypothetical protein